ncbi:MAG: hypothetical protein Q4G23_09385 [Clostridia bacterium]|nr:hypothetical protein [Clostridia bacterium]
MAGKSGVRTFPVRCLSLGITEKTDAAVGMKRKILERIYEAMYPVIPKKGMSTTVSRS